MVLINVDFSKGIIAKYRALVQKRRRFPVLTFLVMKHPPILHFLSLMLKNKVSHSHWNYHLNQDIIFNLDYMARIALEKSTGTRERYFNYPGTETDLNRANTTVTSTLTLASYSYQRFLNTLNANMFSFLAARLEKRLEALPGSGTVSPLLTINQKKWNINQMQRHIIHFPGVPVSRDLGGHPGEKSQPSADMAPFIEKLPGSTAVHHFNSIAVLKPSLTVNALKQTSNHFNGSLSPTAASADDHGKPGRTSSSSQSIPPTAAPGLKYANSFGTVLEDMKKTVTRIEEQIKEEKKLVQKTITEESSHPVPGNRSDSPINSNTNLNQLTDQVYRMMEKKIRIERERRGW